MTHGLRVWRAEAESRRTELAALPDQALLEYARQGETAAFGELYSRHRAAARRLARRLVGGRVEAEDVVGETFARILRVLQRGGGPVDGFRVYLLTVVRRTAWYLENRARREVAVEPLELDLVVDDQDLAVALAERGLMTRAFASLPERWRAVLWHTEVEGEPARQVARILGISPNGVAALSYRARGALRAAYLQAHVADPPAEGCRPFAAKLGGYTVARGRSVERDRIAAHLADCAGCRERAAELRDVRSSLRAAAGPVLLGPAAAGYLAQGKLTVAFAAFLQHGKVTAAATISGAAASGGAVAQLVTNHGRISAAMAGAALTATGALGLVATEPGPEASSQQAVITTVSAAETTAGQAIGSRDQPAPRGQQRALPQRSSVATSEGRPAASGAAPAGGTKTPAANGLPTDGNPVANWPTPTSLPHSDSGAPSAGPSPGSTTLSGAGNGSTDGSAGSSSTVAPPSQGTTTATATVTSGPVSVSLPPAGPILPWPRQAG